MKKTIYTAFGLNISSEYLFPELTQTYCEDREIDVTIETGDLTEYWDSLGPQQDYYTVDNGNIAFNMPGAAIFLVKQGNNIIISPFEGSDERMIRVYLLGSCMGALLLQRKILPLHGSAVVIDGKAFAFIGHSGAGKSTLAAAMRGIGLPLLTDDVIPVTLNEQNIPIIIPAYPQQKLWKKSIDALGLNALSYSPLYQEVDKYAIPVTGQFSQEAVPLAGIFEITVSRNDMTEIRPVLGLHRFPVLFNHTYRNFLVPLLNLEDWHFKMSALIISKASFMTITRSNAAFTADHLTAQILNLIQKGA
ncbi:hypothetical protein [Paenibacillus ihuae]|uniref:hypothetical protein n=1 Tax=Paenibacillus ihuae TaxID=1232431 RepID=UPI0006D5991D|nr:hypothetical protein [Paenibacillus ihuae]